jgi:hypothetical protein
LQNKIHQSLAAFLAVPHWLCLLAGAAAIIAEALRIKLSVGRP